MNKKNNTIERRQVRIRLPDNILAQVKIYSRAKNSSVNQVISTAVEEYLSKNTNNETVFLEYMNKLTRGFQHLIEQEKHTSELVESIYNNLNSIVGNLNKVEYENRTHLILFMDFIRHSYSIFNKEIDSKNRTSEDMESSIRFLNAYLQEFLSFRNHYGTSFVKKTLDNVQNKKIN